MTSELKQKIENEAEYRASLQFHKKYSKDEWQACVITYRQGATEYAELWQAAVARAERAEKALEQIRDWKLPSTGQFWDTEQFQPMSYEACYGSNGVRDYFKSLANHVLNENNEALTPKQGSDE